MQRIHVRCLVVFAACQLLFGAQEGQAKEPWEPISFAIKAGSLTGSFVSQFAARPEEKEKEKEKSDAARDGTETAAESCTLGEIKLLSDKSDYAKACEGFGLYFPRGRRCMERREGKTAAGEPQGEWVVIKDGKNPNAVEFEFGEVELDDTPVPGSKDDVLYVAAGYRRYLLQAREHDRMRIYAGVGAGAYDVESDWQAGLNARVGLELGLNMKSRENGGFPYFTVEVEAIYHWLDSGLDTTDVLGGIRMHLPGKKGP